jgi:hypothetical protein
VLSHLARRQVFHADGSRALGAARGERPVDGAQQWESSALELGAHVDSLAPCFGDQGREVVVEEFAVFGGGGWWRGVSGTARAIGD